MEGIDIRPFEKLEDYEACTALQDEVWGEGFSEKVSTAILMVSQKVGGVSAGAFDGGGRLVGFVFGLTGVDEGELVHWSDMLAVRPEWRDRGLGTRLKHFQRRLLLDLGVRRMLWTFDPLRSRNAYVNFNKLGIVSREYIPNMYGDTGSPLHRGIGTDRLVALWLMDSERVVGRLAGTAQAPASQDVTTLPVVVGEGRGALGTRVSLSSGGFPVPGDPRLDLDSETVLLPVPAELERLQEADEPLALRWRETTRAGFRHYLELGYEVREFFRGEATSHYLLKRGPG